MLKLMNVKKHEVYNTNSNSVLMFTKEKYKHIFVRYIFKY